MLNFSDSFNGEPGNKPAEVSHFEVMQVKRMLHPVRSTRRGLSALLRYVGQVVALYESMNVFRKMLHCVFIKIGNENRCSQEKDACTAFSDVCFIIRTTLARITFSNQATLIGETYFWVQKHSASPVVVRCQYFC